jgi:dCMP deaminase
MRTPNKWDYRYLCLAKHVAGWSKDPSTRVGAVITLDNHVVSLGFNGLPRGVQDTPMRLQARELKYKLIVHGEMNAMNFASCPLKGATLYTYPFMPCSVCAGSVIQHGFKEIVAPYSDNQRWKESFDLTEMILREAGVELLLVHGDIIEYDLVVP